MLIPLTRMDGLHRRQLLWALEKVVHEKDVVGLKHELYVSPKDHIAHVKRVEPPEAARAHVVRRLDEN